ncbi:hypothetical protein G6F40_015613 [Rhizopus arrhizus]|nr:hypothetical protein G6F40_015613 [Rhizopus arrhizus]
MAARRPAVGHLDRRALGRRPLALVVDSVRRTIERARPAGCRAGSGTRLAMADVFIPQTVNLELIQGVSFTKGCYPGQEVVARSHYRGTVKRRMAYGTIADASLQGAALAGVDVFDATQPGEPIGRVVDAASEAGVASVLFETTLAALPAGDLRLGAADGPRIAAAPLPYSITP